jgi:hypothetical protein
MGKKAQVKKSVFEVKPSKNSQSWIVFHVNQNNRRSPTYEFASEKAALNWISYESKAWLKNYEAKRRVS